MDRLDTVEVLKIRNHSVDSWSELNTEYNLKNHFLIFPKNTRVSIRLIGPYLSTERIYVPSGIKSVLSEQNFYGTLNRKMDHFEESIRKVNKYCGNNNQVEIDSLVKSCLSNYSHGERAIWSKKGNTRRVLPSNEYFNDMILFLLKSYYKIGWQKSVLSNAYVYDGFSYSEVSSNIRVSVFSWKSMTELCAVINKKRRKNKNKKINISGFFAYDLNVEKTGEGYSTELRMSLSDKPRLMSGQQVQAIFTERLIDMRSLLKDNNRNENTSYLYKIPKEYRVGEEIMSDFYKQIEDIKKTNNDTDVGECLHNAELENQMQDIPIDHFENRPSYNRPINAIEV